MRLTPRKTRGKPLPTGKAAKKRGAATSGDPRWDRFSQKAKDQGFASRAVFKLAEIDERFKIFRTGQRVLDLGCAPGGWLQYAAQKVGTQGRVVGVDRFETNVSGPQVRTMTGDLTQEVDLGDDAAPFDVVLSDMAPDTIGVRDVDQDRSSELASIALAWATRWGKPGSAFVAKFFQGPDFMEFLKTVRLRYDKVRCVRPEATRKKSIEIYVVATGKREGA